MHYLNVIGMGILLLLVAGFTLFLKTNKNWVIVCKYLILLATGIWFVLGVRIYLFGKDLPHNLLYELHSYREALAGLCIGVLFTLLIAGELKAMRSKKSK